ncbi:hypothetical protein BCV70DRAFT_211949 [Testicularia cyperi]|uniref:Uncharacterized protein n=1 Tax=Testicularia cyperi TaxID=1882483 RepID=A0A317XP90_9BASI|nr:hypothetical protein BCV70DRAFT_211949 [Testicularia cyperi]
MALPLPVPIPTPSASKNHSTAMASPSSRSKPMEKSSPFLPALSMSSFASASLTSSCALTILKGDAAQPISAHAPIHKRSDATSSAPTRSRFANSFASLRSSAASNVTTDTSVNVHAVSDDGILLPFLDRPTEVQELLFETKANESLMYRLCRIFGGSLKVPLQRGVDERWDELLEILVVMDRLLLDDEDWLVRLESLVMERSPALWAQLSRCLGAEGVVIRGPSRSHASRFDSWAFATRPSGTPSRLETPSLASPLSDGGDEELDDNDFHAHGTSALAVSVEPLEDVPTTFSQQPAGRIQHSSLRETVTLGASPRTLPIEGTATEPSAASYSPIASSQDVFPMSHSGDEAGSSSLADILEEPSAGTAASGDGSVRRRRSHSGKFAALRISAMTSSTPPLSRRSSDLSISRLDPSVIASSSSAAASRDRSQSPLPTGAMSPHDGQSPMPFDSPSLAPNSAETSTSFAKHRRLSTMIVHNQQGRDSTQASHTASPRSSIARRLRSANDGLSSSPRPPRRRAESFARSFAELAAPQDHIQHLRAEQREDAATKTSAIAASAPVKDTGALGLHGPSASSGEVQSIKGRRRRLGSSVSSTVSTSPSIPGLLPDGRTRHPSGSCGSKDLSEANMGLSISPSPSERNFSDEAGSEHRSIDSASRKRKGTGAEQPQPTTADAKVSRTHSPGSTSPPEDKDTDFKIEDKQSASGTGRGSGLALGGGFSFAKSGANFRRQSHDAATPLASGGIRTASGRNGLTRSSDYFNQPQHAHHFRSPPSVHRRPGGFVSLAHEYEAARRNRRATCESIFSLQSNALASSPSSSLASLDVGGDSPVLHSRDGPSQDREASLTRNDGQASFKSTRRDQVPTIIATEATPRGTPGAITPKASFGAGSGVTRAMAKPRQEYPFPAPATTSGDSRFPSSGLGLSASSSPAPPAPLSMAKLSPSCFSALRSPTIVFPISPKPSISRAGELQKALGTAPCRAALEKVEAVRGAACAETVRDLLVNTERSEMPDEELLETIGKHMGLVDHERARQLGGKEAADADLVLAEEGYDDRWHAFADLCSALGVGQFELGTAKRRCGPAIDLSRH